MTPIQRQRNQVQPARVRWDPGRLDQWPWGLLEVAFHMMGRNNCRPSLQATGSPLQLWQQLGSATWMLRPEAQLPLLELLSLCSSCSPCSPRHNPNSLTSVSTQGNIQEKAFHPDPNGLLSKLSCSQKLSRSQPRCIRCRNRFIHPQVPGSQAPSNQSTEESVSSVPSQTLSPGNKLMFEWHLVWNSELLFFGFFIRLTGSLLHKN